MTLIPIMPAARGRNDPVLRYVKGPGFGPRFFRFPASIPKEVLMSRPVAMALVLVLSVLPACTGSHYYPFGHHAFAPKDPVREMNGLSSPMP